MVTWGQRRVARAFWRHSFWLMPTLGMLGTLVAAPIVRWIDRKCAWPWFDFTPEGARAVLGALSASMLTFVIFVVTSILVVVQLASAQLTPRIIALTFEKGRARSALTFFTIAFTYSVAASGRVSDVVPQLPAALAVILSLLSISVFFYFAYKLAVDLRPVSVLTQVATRGRLVVASVYPSAFDPERPERCGVRTALQGSCRVVAHRGLSGTFLGFDLRGIVDLATRADAVVELLPQVGDFISAGDPLFRVSPEGSSLDDRALHGCVECGAERTIEQDPRFAFRIVVDIANKALSPAINDPTTAVLAVDQLHRLLLVVGSRRLDEGEVSDASGRLRLIYGTPDWDDYVSLSVSEIRHYGTGSVQIARRLAALLDHLVEVLPPARHRPLLRERALLKRSVQRAFADEEDRLIAAVGDSQGMGGSELAEGVARNGGPSAPRTGP
jgi:uncharacterized membrane protein